MGIKKKKKPVSIEVVVQFDRLDDRDSSSAFAISEERSNLQWNFLMTSRWKIVVPRDTADYLVKS